MVRATNVFLLLLVLQISGHGCNPVFEEGEKNFLLHFLLVLFVDIYEEIKEMHKPLNDINYMTRIQCNHLLQ